MAQPRDARGIMYFACVCVCVVGDLYKLNMMLDALKRCEYFYADCSLQTKRISASLCVVVRWTPPVRLHVSTSLRAGARVLCGAHLGLSVNNICSGIGLVY